MLAVKKRRLIVVKRLLLTIMKRLLTVMKRLLQLCKECWEAAAGGGWPDLGAENPRARSLVPLRLADISG